MEFIEIESGIGHTSITPSIPTEKQKQVLVFNYDIDESYRTKRHKNKILITRWKIVPLYNNRETIEISTDKDYEINGKYDKGDDYKIKDIIISSRKKFDFYLNGEMKSNSILNFQVDEITDDYIEQLLMGLTQFLSRL